MLRPDEMDTGITNDCHRQSGIDLLRPGLMNTIVTMDGEFGFECPVQFCG